MLGVLVISQYLYGEEVEKLERGVRKLYICRWYQINCWEVVGGFLVYFTGLTEWMDV